jgi:SAM-dependent methyltransferase
MSAPRVRRTFSLTADEIEANRHTNRAWYTFVRRREAEMVFSLFPGRRYARALELGAGDGNQSAVLARHCDHLVCTEKDPESYAWFGEPLLRRSLPNVDYRLCDAEDLSAWEDGRFDLVYTSNLLEHVARPDVCLRECRRVLAAGGLMLHVMPSRTWKLANGAISLAGLHRPQIHGVSTSNWEELVAFGAGSWAERLRAAGLRLTELIGLPFYLGHGNTWIPLIKLGNRAGLSASYLYVVEKAPHSG